MSFRRQTLAATAATPAWESCGKWFRIYATDPAVPAHPSAAMLRLSLLFLVLAVLMCVAAQSSDLPTVSVDHLYYLRARGEHIRRLSADDLVDYCIAQKLGGRAFEDLYSQLFLMRIDLTKLQRVEGVSDEDSRVKTLKKTYAAEYGLLSEEAQRIQRGLVREGFIAAEALESISRAQQGR
jgi:hypothetical protein